MKNRKVSKFNELMAPEESEKLGLFQFMTNSKDNDYFFDEKEVDRFYDEDVIKIYVKSVSNKGEWLIFDIVVTINTKEFQIYLFTDLEGNVQFGSEKGKSYVNKFKEELSEEFDYFIDMFTDVYDDIIPHDFWEVKSRNN
jgi:hypothetical protein